MKFIHIADVHLGVVPDKEREWSEKRVKEIDESFDRIIDKCEEDKIDLLLIAGDLFHFPPSETMLKDLDNKLAGLTVTRTVIIAGNRDYIEEGSFVENFTFRSSTSILPRDKASNVYLKSINTCVAGFSYGKPNYKERKLEEIKPGVAGAINIMLGHGGDANHMPFSKEKLARQGFDYIALGHIHKPAHILKNRMAFSGALEPLDISDTGRRGYIFGEILDGKTNISWLPFNNRSYVNLSLELKPIYGSMEIQDVLETQINKMGKDNIYQINLKGKLKDDVNINLNKLTNKYNIYEVINNTFSEQDVEILLDENQDNLLGRYINAIDDGQNEETTINKKALRYGIEALLGAGENNVS